MARSQKDYYTDQAHFCLASGVSPKEYDEMTIDQRNAWVEVMNKQAKKK